MKAPRTFRSAESFSLSARALFCRENIMIFIRDENMLLLALFIFCRLPYMHRRALLCILPSLIRHRNIEISVALLN